MKYLYLLLLCCISLSCKTDTKRNLYKITGKRILINDSIESNVNINKMIAPYKEKLDADMNRVLTYAPKDFTKKDGNMQSTLGNLVADLSYEMANPILLQKNNMNIDFVFLNNGGLRAAIPKGNITTKNAFMLMPFENELVVAQLKGKDIKALFTYFIQSKSAHPISKNVQIYINASKNRFLINGALFDENKSYTVLTSDYLQNGGDNMDFFLKPIKLINLNYKVRDAIIDYFLVTDTLQVELDNRIIIE